MNCEIGWEFSLPQGGCYHRAVAGTWPGVCENPAVEVRWAGPGTPRKLKPRVTGGRRQHFPRQETTFWECLMANIGPPQPTFTAGCGSRRLVGLDTGQRMP